MEHSKRKNSILPKGGGLPQVVERVQDALDLKKVAENNFPTEQKKPVKASADKASQRAAIVRCLQG